MLTCNMKYLVVLLSVGFMFSSCNNLRPDCEALTKSELQMECIVIASELPTQKSSNYFVLKGTNIYTNSKKTIIDPGRKWSQYKKHIEIGDTLIKRRGELTAYIHKRGEVLVFPWKCGGEVYNDSIKK